QRQQIEAVVLENGGQRTRVAAAHELEVTRGDLEAGNVAHAARAEQLPLERDERALALAPESSRRMEHVDVGRAVARPLEAMKQVPRFEQRRIERLAVKAD